MGAGERGGVSKGRKSEKCVISVNNSFRKVNQLVKITICAPFNIAMRLVAYFQKKINK